MPRGYERALYILPFDHRGSFQSGLSQQIFDLLLLRLHQVALNDLNGDMDNSPDDRSNHSAQHAHECAISVSNSPRPLPG